jgi:hypothetical protein
MFLFNHLHQGTYYLSLLKLLLKYIVVVASVVWLYMQPHHRSNNLTLVIALTDRYGIVFH